MAKLIITVEGRPYVHGYKRSDFHYDPALNCYIHNKKFYDEKEFNEVAPEAIKKAVRHHLIPSVKIVEFSAGEAPTIESATAFLAEHAPHLLRKQRQPRAEPALVDAT